jgi:hypothetical protein
MTQLTQETAHSHDEYADGFDDGKTQAYEECAMLALQWAAEREPEFGGNALSNFSIELTRRAGLIGTNGGAA